jgi:hypothetical protein
MEKEITLERFSNPDAQNFNCKAPSLFTIPKDIYEDELNRDTDKVWCKKMLKLEQSSQHLKSKFNEYYVRYNKMIATTKTIIDNTHQLNNYVRENVLSKKQL